MNCISINNSKIANAIKKYDNLTGARNIISVSTRGAKVTKDVQFVIKDNLTVFDMAIADAIYSLKMQGEKKFTARKILKIMSGDEAISVCKERKYQIEERIDRLMENEIYIDCREEANENILPRYQGNFINAIKEGNGYKILEDNPFPLYAYAEAKRHIITIPWELLNYQTIEGREKNDRIVNSNENILLKYYLLQQLEIVRNKKNKVNEKIFSLKNKKDIYKILEINEEVFTEESLTNKIRDIYRRTELLFEYWKRLGYIVEYKSDRKDYSFYVSQDMLCDNVYKTINIKNHAIG